ncbi:helix-turn-helix domain-containing protein [Erythrobacter sp. sf7]|uniref:Helix-turn-helix domain-containing protein n=1 Tax=Erythrobacter fulvus TaxID=2987523 RepID=A0ABT5JRF7_9SPHN|nr:helix-turn-helix domain-containing protein [Erythrobacter fulvus]MDC8755347.1 helix-turn-helix domain-containing protein [Erythrobacter fulvus]
MAIRAHLDQSVARESQRSAHRRSLRLETSGALPGSGESNVVIHNISATGLLIETGLEVAVGEELAIDLPAAGQVFARIIWRSDRLYGCAFSQPLNAGALAAAQLKGLPVSEVTQPARPTPMANPAETLGLRLARLRREAGLTLADVAARLGVSKPTVWAWEKGKARPLPERMEAIADALGAATEDLAGSNEGDVDLNGLIDDCRTRIAIACGASPNAVRIMIEL